MTASYDIVWQVLLGAPGLSRKSYRIGEYPALSYDEIIDGFANPDVIDLGDELVVYQHRPSGRLDAEGWRLVQKSSSR